MCVPTLCILLRTPISSLHPKPFLQDPGVQPAPLSCESAVEIKGQETYDYVLQVISGVAY